MLFPLTAKHPYLRVSVTGEECEGVQPGKFQDVLCFGSVPVGTTVEKCVEIFNMSVVRGERDSSSEKLVCWHIALGYGILSISLNAVQITLV